MNIFYGIEKSPDIRSKHRRGLPSFGVLNEEKNKRHSYLTNLTKNFKKYSAEKMKDYNNNSNNNDTDENKIFSLYEFTVIDNTNDKKPYINKKSSKNNFLNQFSFKQVDNFFDSEKESNIGQNDDEAEDNNINKDGKKIIELNRIDEINNQVLIFKDSNNNELISFLNNENKGEYILKIVDDITEVENELKDNNGICMYKVLLINMGNIKEIKFAENVCENKGENLIFGYYFGVHTKSKEKSNVKFDKRFDLSLSYEGILYALKQNFH